MNEIGSEFSAFHADLGQKHTVNWLPTGNDHAFVFSGRTAIETVLRDVGDGAKKALLPDYCCGSMIEPFYKAGVEVLFYHTGLAEGGAIRLEIPDDCDIFLWCNYFGFRRAYPKQEIARMRERDGIVIEDITHSLLSEKQCHEYSDYLVASLRKWGALFSGGFCSKATGQFAEKPEGEPSTAFLRQKAKAMMLKEEYLRDGVPAKKERYLQLFAQSNRWLADNWSGLAMDEDSKCTLFGWDVSAMRAQRRKNAMVLYDGLAECSGVEPLFPMEAMDCPLFVPICVKTGNRDEVRRRLIAEEIYCPVHWPMSDLHRLDSRMQKIYDSELSLVCDQRYTVSDMERICAAICEFWR